ncbi:MAG: YceD family protein [Bdellovibrionales bacterium]
MPHPHLALSPTVIYLNELPQEGRRFVYTEQTGELTPTLKDLIGKNPYRVEIEVKPMGNVFSAEGSIQTGLDELCSLCAIEFIQPVKEKFNEILVIQTSPHEGHQARVNHSSELNLDGPECTELESDSFSVGDYIHELVALSRPIKPLGKSNCDNSCENYQEAVRKGWLTPENNKGFKPENPFSKLAKVKLNS